MKTLMNIAAFRLLAPDDGAGGGAPLGGSSAQEIDPFGAEAVEAAYEAAHDAPDDAGATDEEDEEEEGAVADADPETDEDALDDGFLDDEPFDDESLDDETLDDETADLPAGWDGPPGEIPAEIAERYPAVQLFTDLDAALMDPATAPETARWFVETIAAKHGRTLEDFLGVEPASPSSAHAEGADWEALGYDSREEFEAQPEYVRQGFDSENEFWMSQEIAELRELVRPMAEERARAAREQAEARARADWEGAIARVAPTAIAAVRAELGWQASPAQALEAARRLPELASRPGGLKDAISMVYVREIAKANQARGRGERAPVPPMPRGEGQGGARRIDPMDEGFEAFANSVASQY